MLRPNRDKKIAKSGFGARLTPGGAFGYALSVLMVALSTGATLLMQDYTFRTTLFLPAILLSTWFGGTGPGLLAVLLSTLSINFFFLEPRLAFSFSLHDALHLVVFLFSALLISSWSSARKRAENRLRESEQRWRGLTEALPQLVWGATADGACDYFSRQWTDYTNVSERDLLGWQWMTLLHPDDREPTRKVWMDSVAGRAPYDVEYRVRRKDGVYGWFKTRGVPIRDEEGNIEKWFGTCTDITGHKEAEASLRESEAKLRKARDELESKIKERTADLSRSNEQLRLEIVERERTEGVLREQASLLNLTHDTIFVRDMKDVITYWNRGAQQQYGWSSEEAVGAVSHELMQTSFPAPVEQINTELLETGRWEGELVHTRRDQRKMIVASRWALQRDEAQKPVAILETNNDITEHKQAEEALRASEQVARGQVEALAQSLDVLATAPEPEKFIGQMLSTIGRFLNAQTVTLWLFDESTDSLFLKLTADGAKPAAPDPQHPFMKDPSVWKQNRIIQELLFTAGPVVCEDLETDPRVSGKWRDYLQERGTKRFLAVPILVGGRVRGFIGVRHADRAPYRPEEIELTQALAHQVMLAIQLNEFAEQGQRAAVFEERNRMARDIHDTLAQGFTGVIVQLEAAEDAVSCGCREEADKHLRRAGDLARRSLTEARRSVHALRPQALEKHNFWDALKGTIKNTTAGTALHTTFQAQGKIPELPHPWQENLLHIGQEALTNTLKYAHARNFETRLSYEANELRLELRDDGDGFNLKDRHDGVGLRGMRERVEQMGGELEITSSRGKGTKIAILLPCNGESTS